MRGWLNAEFAPPLEVSDLGYPPKASTAVCSSTFGLAERVSDDLQVLEQVDPQGTSRTPAELVVIALTQGCCAHIRSANGCTDRDVVRAIPIDVAFIHLY